MSRIVEGKVVVVVTGAGQGIGREFALAFARHGAKVIVNDIAADRETDENLAERVVLEARAAGGEALASLLFNQIRMLRSVHRGDGWMPEQVAEHALPAFAADFTDNLPTVQVMPWDPI